MTREEGIDTLVKACIEGYTYFNTVRSEPQVPTITIQVQESMTKELLRNIQSTFGGWYKSYDRARYNGVGYWILSKDPAYELSVVLLKRLKKLPPTPNITKRIIAINEMNYRWRQRQCA